MNRENLTKIKPASYFKSYMIAVLYGTCKVITVDCVISFWKLA